MPKVLITSRSFGQVSSEPIDLLRENNIQFEFMSGKYDENKFINYLEDCDALIIGAHELSPGAVAKAKKLKLVCKHGTGLDNIDLKLAKQKNIMVTNVPASNSDAVADVTVALMLDVARKISVAAASVKSGKWEKVIGRDVCNKSLGLIGFGAIARKVAQRCRGFGMRIYAYDPFVKDLDEPFKDIQLVSFEKLLENSDFISVHVPLTKDTKDLISTKQLSQMKKGSYLFNTSRGGVVNEKALYTYLTNGHLAGAGLDVTEEEPPTGNPLIELDNVTVLPHIGMYSVEAIGKVSLVCAQNVVRLFKGEKLCHQVV